MSAPLKVIIIFVLWLLYTLFLLRSCSDTLCTGCMPGEAAAVEEAVTVRYPIDFQWDNPTANTNQGYPALRQSILDGMTDNNQLEITGYYFEGEPAPPGYENMGFARADRVRQLFMPDVPADRIVLKARMIAEKEGVRTGYFEATGFDWVEPTAVAQTLEELEDRVHIRFPYNSTAGEYTPEVLDYLQRLADRMKTTGQRIRLIGHTDNSGTAEYNMELGQARADAIKKFLVDKGIDPAQITTESRGESQPEATNETLEGRHENRRVEVRLLPQ